MPFTLPPINRRQFVSGTLAMGGSALLFSGCKDSQTSDRVIEQADPPELDPNRVAILADTHISDDPKRIVFGTKWPGTPVKPDDHEGVNMAECLVQTAQEIVAQRPRPAHVIVNGDCAYSSGTPGEYQEFLRLVEPMRSAGITIHVTIGNHDHRQNLWNVLPFLKKEQLGIQADVIELEFANLVLLDSGNAKLGDQQLKWLAKQLDQRPGRPALVFSHYNPYPNRGIRPLKGMRDGSALLELLAERTHAKVYFYGHTHEWQTDRRDHVHIINQPAVSYYFGKGHAHGWLDMKLGEDGCDLELRCLNDGHGQHLDNCHLSWRDVGPG